MLTKEEIKEMHITAFDEVMKEKLVPLSAGSRYSGSENRRERFALQREMFGKDMTGLTEKTKKDFAEVAQNGGCAAKFDRRHQGQ